MANDASEPNSDQAGRTATGSPGKNSDAPTAGNAQGSSAGPRSQAADTRSFEQRTADQRAERQRAAEQKRNAEKSISDRTPASENDSDNSHESERPTDLRDSERGKGPLEYVVRFGAMRILGVMKSMHPYRYGDEVIVRTDRGSEIGTVLCEATPTALDYMNEKTQGRIVRRLTDDDRNQWGHLDSMTSADLTASQRHVARLGLEMQLVDIERILGGERMVVYFIAENRIDFRQLVRDLGKEFQTRIEMRQIGVRDEAKLLADYGDCGQPICCANHLTKMPPVSMRMAKVQKATLDPTKISGRCGRLKCCLRYEFDTYEAYAAELPPVGSQILTRDGAATVTAQNILAQQLVIRTEDNRRIMIFADDVVSVTKRASNESKSRRKKDKRKETK